ncbi:hypothetical protein CCR75_005182 [Bremia lactucae]|uniref:Uncharacterized protein n=1 Tax=Bremia lactucae TaxID=4779 RepID=A0A976FEY8_BRELC|nr:hypothetical protein CCR75_006821 [Bremia lactucae]TDH70355.1 hypothetical protein CCR75_005182 [Bremia lactucae]
MELQTQCVENGIFYGILFESHGLKARLKLMKATNKDLRQALKLFLALNIIGNFSSRRIAPGIRTDPGSSSEGMYDTESYHASGRMIRSCKQYGLFSSLK